MPSWEYLTVARCTKGAGSDDYDPDRGPEYGCWIVAPKDGSDDQQNTAHPGPDAVMTPMDRLGGQGWELVGMEYEEWSETTFYWLKRHK